MARVRVEKVSKDHELHLPSDDAICLVLVSSCSASQEEQQSPCLADFSPHLEIQRSKTRVERRTHKKVINMVARHAVSSSLDKGNNVDDNTDEVLETKKGVGGIVKTKRKRKQPLTCVKIAVVMRGPKLW